MGQLAANFKCRSPLERGIRAVLSAAVGVLGYFAATHSVASAMPERALEIAHQLAPDHARITAELSLRQVGVQSSAILGLQLSDKATAARLAEPERLARMALRSDATAVSAVTTLGLVAQLRGEAETARQLFAYSERLSRRDLPTQLWMIEDAVGRNNIAKALHHYDTALRTKWGAWDLLFPRLANASNDPLIAAELIKLLAARPTWTESFISFVATNSSDPAATARLFRGLSRADVPVSDGARAPVINALIAAKQFDAAWAYYASVRSGPDRRRSRDPDFAVLLDQASQLDWIPAASDSGLTAMVQRAGRGGLFDFSAPPSVGGTLLQQTQLLPPGRYALEGRSVGIRQPKHSQPYWVLTCMTDGSELGRVAVPNSGDGEGLFAGYITVPPSCPAQLLTLVARASNALEGLSGQIDRVQLRPAQ